MHLKIIDNPISFTLDEMVSAMRQVYGNFGIGVFIRTTEDLTTVLPPATITDFLTIDIGDCVRGTTTTEQDDLFNNRNNVGNNEIVVYFVQSTNPPSNCCAAHPNDIDLVL